jgi:nitrite reductase (NO-forming)
MSRAQTTDAKGAALPLGNRMPTPSAGWTGTIARVIFGIIFSIDAYLKWLPGYRNTYLSQLKTVAHGQPSWLHGWFHLWITVQSSAPTVFAVLTGIAETGLALCLLLGVARRLGYTAGAVYTLLIWGIGEGFGGPYTAGTTDVGTGIVYTLLFATLLTFAPPPTLPPPPRGPHAWPWTGSLSPAGPGGAWWPSRTRSTGCAAPRSSSPLSWPKTSHTPPVTPRSASRPPCTGKTCSHHSQGQRRATPGTSRAGELRQMAPRNLQTTPLEGSTTAVDGSKTRAAC